MKGREGTARIWALFLVGMLAWIWASGLAYPADLYVDATFGNDTNDGLSWGTAKATVGDALTAADGTPEADTIYVAEGIYQETVDLWSGPDDVSLIGGFPAGGGIRNLASNATVVDAQGNGRALEIYERSNIVVDGFILQNGDTDAILYEMGGGGIACVDSVNVTIQNCIVRANTARAMVGRCMLCDCAGGGCMDVDLPPAWGYGGGVHVSNSSVTFVNNLVIDNHIVLYDPDCTNTCGGLDPTGSEGAGMYLDNVTGTVANNTIASNDNLVPATYLGYAMLGYRSGGVYLENVSPSLTFRDNIMWGNTPSYDYCEPSGLFQPVYCDADSLMGDFSGPGNIQLNPLFADGPVGDYYLSQTAAGQAVNSPCLDAGSDTVAAVGMTSTTTRTDDVEDSGTVDMGYHNVLCSTGGTDTDGDGVGDACDTCTDTDGDGFGDPGFPANICVTDNCPTDANPLQEDADLDGIGNLCDVCPNDPYNDIDGDDVCGDVDNCPAVANCDDCADCAVPLCCGDGPNWWECFDGIDNNGNGLIDESQCTNGIDDDADGLIDETDCTDGVDNDFDSLIDDQDQDDTDADGAGDACDVCPGFDDGLDADSDGTPDGCDTCTDTDGDGLGDPGFPANTCATDPCPAIPSVPAGCIPAGSIYPTDINCDGCVDGMDLGFIGRAFGEFCGDPYYNADADLDASGAVDGTDLGELISDFGSGCT